MVSASVPQICDSFEHEALELFRDPQSGLTGAIAIHSTALGPAMGGLRLRSYPSIEEAAIDALRLARAMTYKNAAAGLALGGGKAVVIDDGRWDEHRLERWDAFAQRLNRLEGRYITAEDVGTGPADMDRLARGTRWVAGRSELGGGRGDPSSATAHTVFTAIRTAIAFRLAHLHPADVRVGVLGAGHVGGRLVDLLLDAGMSVDVADVNEAATERWAGHPRVARVGTEGFIARELDVLAPCAMGELVCVADVPHLRCAIVAGAANNPLVDELTAVALDERGILYVPDFLANCGGIIHVGGEALGTSDLETHRLIDAAEHRLQRVLRRAREEDRVPVAIAREEVETMLRGHRSRGAAPLSALAPA